MKRAAALMLMLTSGAALAQTQVATLNYTVDAGLVYVDRLSRPSPEGAVPPLAAATAAAPRTPRTLGLERLRLALDWMTPRSASLHVVLRPDAVNRRDEAPGPASGPTRELDTRAGDPYRPAPTVRLLDAYQLTLDPGASLSGSVGVWEALERPAPAYREALGFGLGVALPAKFGGARVRWEKRPEGPATAGPQGIGALVADVYLIQGDEDRGEATGARSRSFDTAPVAHDPYYGGATQVAWMASPVLELGLLVGYLDGSDAVGRRNEVLAQLTTASRLAVAARDLVLGLDARYAKEHWRAAGVKDLTQASVALTAAWHWSRETAALLGLMHGRSGRAVDSVSGYGVEAGLARTLGQGLGLQLMLSHERRVRETPGQAKAGGFRDATGDHGVVRRMGLQLSYLLNENA